MEKETLVGKKITIKVDSDLISIKVLSIIEGVIQGIIIKNGTEIFIPLIKVSYWTKVNDENELYVHVCKNDVAFCKGFRLVSSNKEVTWPCNLVKQNNCEKGCVGKFSDMPIQLRQQTLELMHSNIPVVDIVKQPKT